MTNENLVIDCKELFALKSEYPTEIAIIMEMLAEAGEDYYAEMCRLKYPIQSAA